MIMSPHSMVSLLAGVAAGLFYAADIGSIQRWRSVSRAGDISNAGTGSQLGGGAAGERFALGLVRHPSFPRRVQDWCAQTILPHVATEPAAPGASSRGLGAAAGPGSPRAYTGPTVRDAIERASMATSRQKLTHLDRALRTCMWPCTQPQAARPVSPPPEALIAELEAMGFARPQVIAALQSAGNNASRAVDLLLAQQQ